MGGEPMFNGERLAEIRIVRNMTQEQLAVPLGISKQMVSRYEDGKNIPQSETVKKMAQLLSIPIKCFYKDNFAFDTKSSTVFFRANIDTSKKVRENIKIAGKWGYEILKANEKLSNPFLTLSIDNNLTIPEKATVLKQKWGIGDNPVENMVALLEIHGFNIFTVDFPGLKTEACSQIINGIPIIVINKNIGTAVRQRFSLAHELGHMILHRGIAHWDFEIRNTELEKEAHEFAEYFLLPMKGFEKSLLPLKIEKLIELKRKWKVSLAALAMHCKNTGLIDASECDALHRFISTRGWKKFEPLDDEFEYEKPYAMGQLALSTATDKDTFLEFFDKVLLPADIIESLCSLPNDTFTGILNGSFDMNDTAGFEQLDLSDIGGDHNA